MGIVTDVLDIGYAQKIDELENHYKPWAKRSTKSLGRKYQLSASQFRTPFERDCHRTLHSLPFRRLKHKTQVFFSPKDDHICTRLEHSLHVASISTTVCKRLDLNPTLAEAIALAHDLGHPPFGYLGEKALEKICLRNHLPSFKHEAQSLRVIDNFCNSLHDPLNLTFEVRDGVVCHYGEKNEQSLSPSYQKDITSVGVSAARRQRPATIEGCVVRLCDTISYLGRDFEDACMAGLLSQNDLPDAIGNALGGTNSQIIGSLIDDLVENSTNKNKLEFSSNTYSFMLALKDFNYQRIYGSPELQGQKNRIYLILSQLFDHYVNELTQGIGRHDNYYCQVFADFIRQMNYSKQTLNAEKVVDYIAGMTDNFALACFEALVQIERIV